MSARRGSERFAVRANRPVRRYHGRSKRVWQHLYDAVGFPARSLLPYRAVQRLGLTDLGRERRLAALPFLQGRVLDIGCGPINELRHEYDGSMVSCDVFPWGHDQDCVCAAEALPFADDSYDTLVMLACLNHFRDKVHALREARRVLRPGGRLVVSMPYSRRLGSLVHLLVSWFDYDHVRGMAEEEDPGLDRREVLGLIQAGGLVLEAEQGFVYGLNRLYVARA